MDVHPRLSTHTVSFTRLALGRFTRCRGAARWWFWPGAAHHHVFPLASKLHSVWDSCIGKIFTQLLP